MPQTMPRFDANGHISAFTRAGVVKHLVGLILIIISQPSLCCTSTNMLTVHAGSGPRAGRSVGAWQSDLIVVGTRSRFEFMSAHLQAVVAEEDVAQVLSLIHI